MLKKFRDLSEREILALAISSEDCGEIRRGWYGRWASTWRDGKRK